MVVQDEDAMRSEDCCSACLGPCEALSSTLFAGTSMYGKVLFLYIYI